MSFLLLLGQSAPLLGNPTGGAVVAGGATIGSAGKTLTINQSSNLAIINWQTFSIASGETTKFFVPTSSSATLNRVLGGNPSAIFGTLSSNGQLFLINPAGIVVGAGGRIDTAGFLGSTLNVSDDAFLKGGSLTFSGASTAAIDNQGTINGSNGDVYLIASQVSNEGALTAPKGNVGLAAGSSVLYQPVGDQHLFIQPTPAGTTRATGVTNAGTIQAASAELRAAGGNAYALAINNSGSIAATGYQKINGQVYLTADTGAIANGGTIRATGPSTGGTVQLASQTGTVTNSGTIDVSATGTRGKGGSVLLKSTQGLTANIASGVIKAKGGNGGAGGQVELSGAKVNTDGFVDTRATHGQVGMFTIDPATLTIAPTGGDDTGTHIGSELATSDITLNADTAVTINDSITWSSSHTLAITTNTSGSTIAINDPITGTAGTLSLTTAGLDDPITTGASGTIHVSSFILNNGFWNQNSATLPAFAADSNFEISGGTFLRVTGGTGSSTPYQITDVYGLQGLASPSKELFTASAELVGTVNASSTASWNSGAGFVPIGFYDGSDSSDANAYSGTFNGQNHTISGLTINLPSSTSVGLFGDTASGSTVENLNLTGFSITGSQYTGGVVGVNNATLSKVTASGQVTGMTYVGGLAGISAASTVQCSSSGTVTGVDGATDVGGLIGYLQQNAGDTAGIVQSSATGAVSAGANSSAVGGLVGINAGGAITESSSANTVSAGTGSSDVGGLVGLNQGNLANDYSSSTVSGGSQVGGLIGTSQTGTIETSYASGSVSGSSVVGGLIGEAAGGTIGDSYYSTASGASAGIADTGSATISYLGTSAANVTGLSATQLKVQSNFDSAWDFTTIWTTSGGTTAPTFLPAGAGTGSATLTGTAYTNGGITIAPGVTITLIFDGTVLGTTPADSSGDFSFNVPTLDLGSGLLLTETTNKGDLFFQSGSAATSFSGLDLWGSTLRIVADSASNAALKAAIAGLSGNGINYGVSGTALTTTTGVNLDLVSNYTVDGNMTSAGTFTAEAGSVLAGSAAATLQGTSVTLGGNLQRTGPLAVTSTTGPITLTDVGSSGDPATVQGLTLTSAQAVLIGNSYLTLGGGNFSATGTGYTSTTDQNGEANGINLFNTTILAQGGSITLNGTAGYTNPGNGIEAGLGVGIGCDGSTPAELATTGTGSITINGTFNQNITSTTFFSGVDLYSNGAVSNINTLSTQNGAITITGKVLKGTAAGTAQAGGSIVGVNIESGVSVAATGTGAVSVSGTTTAATSQVNGGNFQFIEGVGIQGSVSTSSGNLTISGASGTVNTSNSTLVGTDTTSAPTTVGVVVDSTASISAGNGATVSITGTGGAVVTTGAFTGESGGVEFNSSSSLTLGTNGTLVITGTGGAVNAGNGTHSGDAGTQGVQFGGSVAIGTGGSVNVTGTGGALDISNATAPTDSNLPTSAGISLGGNGNGNGASLIAQGTTTVTFTGTGGNVTSSAGDKLGGSIGVTIGNDQSELDQISTGSGLLKITGVAGSAPSLAIGVVINGFDGTTTSVTSTSGNVQITGTGGAGYTGTGTVTGNYIPSVGVGIFDDATVGATNGAVSITGTAGANSPGVAIFQLNDSLLDSAPITPTVSAGTTLTVTSTTGGVILDAGVTAASATITSPGALTFGATGSTGTITTGALTATASGPVEIDGAIVADGAATIKSTGGDITIGPNGSLTDTGAGHNLTLVAGTSLATGHNFINDSNSGAGAIAVANGALVYIYSDSPSGDQFNGITTANTIFGATYPNANPPAGSTEFFYSAATGTATSDTLSGTAFSDSGATFSAGDQLTLIYDGTILGTTTTNSTGAFSFTVSSADVGSGLLLTDSTDHGNTYFQSGNSATTFTGIDLWGSTLRVIADVASNAALKTVLGALTGNGIDYGVSGANLSTASGINLDLVSNYTVDGNMTAAGSFSTESSSFLTGGANATLKGTVVTMTGSFDRTGSLTVDSTAGAIEINNLGNSDVPAVVHGLTLNAVGGSAVLDNSFVDLAGGSLSMTGIGSGATLDGVDLSGTTVDAQGGNITLNGHAGYDSETTDAGVGLSIDTSTLTTSGAGTISLTGDGSPGTSGSVPVDTFMAGVLVYSSTLTTGSGAITVTGTVNHGTSSQGVAGLDVEGSTLQAAQNGGSIALTGNAVGSTATDSENDGAIVYCNSGNFISTLNGGGVHITGNAGSVVLDSESNGPNPAYGLTLGADISTTGSAPISLTGTGGTITDHSSGGSIQATGLDLYDSGESAETISTGSGNITLTGTGGASDNSGFGVGLFAYSQSPITLQSSSGNISITGTGGAGNPGTAAESATYEPNIGVAIGDAINITATAGNVTITGTGRNAPGIKVAPFAAYFNGTDAADPEPVNPSITAGAALKLVSLSGAVYSDAVLDAAATTITSPGTLTLMNSLSEGPALTTGTLAATAAGAATLDNEIDTNGTATISTDGGDITFGSSFTITDTGTGHDLTIAAGTSLPHSHYILNDSEGGANAVQVSNGAQFDLFSADPTNDQFNGITVPQNNVVFNATFPSSQVPAGNGELFYVANAESTGPNPVGGGNTGGGGGGGGNPPPTNPTQVAASGDGSGSNVVPPAIVPQNNGQPPAGALPPPPGGNEPPPPPGFGGEVGGSNNGAGGLANASGNSSVVGAGDETVTSKDGGVGNNTNPAASDALGQALGPAVHNVLNLALTQIGDYTDTNTVDNSPAAGGGGGSGETTLNDGDVVEIGGSGGVKAIDPNQAPEPLKKALGNGVLHGLPGH